MTLISTLKRLRRHWKHWAKTESVRVWTMDTNRRIFPYDIRIAAVKNRSQYLVKFIRTGSAGNPVVIYRRCSPAQVLVLKMQAS